MIQIMKDHRMGVTSMILLIVLILPSLNGQNILEEVSNDALQLNHHQDPHYEYLISSSTRCNTLPSSVHVTKDEWDDAGSLIRTCEGEVIVSKCEGTCSSELRPSVASPTGFQKDCMCCREKWMRNRDVELTKCFYPTGERIVDPIKAMMIIRMQEPEGCECHNCGLSS